QSSRVLGLLHFQFCKVSEILGVYIRDQPEFESAPSPMYNVITILGVGLRCRAAVRFRRPDKQVNHMFVTLVDHGRYLAPIDKIQTPSDQAEAVLSKILNGRGKFEFSGEPRLDGMLISRRDIEKVSGQQRAHMIGDDLCFEPVAGRAIKD